MVVPDAIPPIIPLELFEDVQEKIAKNKKAPARRKAEDDYLLTTKLFCGYCGALMFGESGTSRTGEVHRYYKCATAKKHKGCKKKTVRKQWLEDLVVNQTMQLVKDDAAMESIIAKVMELQNKENTNIPLYKKQLRDAESGIQNMLNAIQAGILTSFTKERLEQLEETKRELEARIAEEKLAKPTVTGGHKYFICKYVWEHYSTNLENSGDLFYTWQYDIRWAATELRKTGRMKPAEQSPRGIWEIV